jgi:spore coat polysaccharide biosynthesis protein SpsF
MRVVCIVQARMGSTRLPGKVLLPLNGHTVIGEVLTRCKRIAGVDEVVCATPDAEILHEAARYVSVFKGPEHDVLLRYRLAAEFYGADLVMRITADCPLICPGICGGMLYWMRASEGEFASNVYPERNFPKGYDCEIFTMDVLRRADLEAGPDEREHVTTWMNNNIPVMNFTDPWGPMDGRLTLDTWDDYKTICAAFDHEAGERVRLPEPPRASLSATFGTGSGSKH